MTYNDVSFIYLVSEQLKLASSFLPSFGEQSVSHVPSAIELMT